MPRVMLTDRSLRALAVAKVGRATYLDKTLPGLGLRVTPNGARSWVIVYR